MIWDTPNRSSSVDLRSASHGASYSRLALEWQVYAKKWPTIYSVAPALRNPRDSAESHAIDNHSATVRSRYKRQLIQLKMNKKWPTWFGTEDSRPIFSCKQFSYNENALYCSPRTRNGRETALGTEDDCAPARRIKRPLGNPHLPPRCRHRTAPPHIRHLNMPPHRHDLTAAKLYHPREGTDRHW